MRVFITGGTGTLGSPVVTELLGNGHTVLALARTDASAKSLTDAGAEVLCGTLSDLDVLRDGVRRTDGVIHLAFGNDAATPDALVCESLRRQTRWRRWARSSSAVTGPSSSRPVRRGLRGARPPRQTRHQRKDRSGVGAVQWWHC